MTKFILWIALIIVGMVAATLAIMHYPTAQSAAQLAVIPGTLSKPHAFLENNCVACHTPSKGVEAKNCIVCHADNIAILQRQPSAFHADITSCVPCHTEHQGPVARTTKMDHAALADIGLKQITTTRADDPALVALVAWLKEGDAPPQNPHLQRSEALLNCVVCHQTKDKHVGLFGTDCASCHGTTKWTLAEFRHPSASSQSCSQCHQAPPSHYMMHFKMIDQAICNQPNAKVNQCFLCHQTTAWNDIRGVGYYKHH